MKPEQQRIKIAEACGQKMFVIYKINRGYYQKDACGYTNDIRLAWQVTEDVAKKHATGPAYAREPDRVITEPAPLPDYLNDLNAMHEAEKVLTEDQARNYSELLRGFQVVHFGAIHATASQRAEAFLRTLGLWED